MGKRYVVVVFDGVSLGIMSFAFGVFDMAAYYGVLPDLNLQIVSGESQAALTGGGLACPVPYDLDAIRTADLIIIPNWRDPAEPPPPTGARSASPCPEIAADWRDRRFQHSRPGRDDQSTITETGVSS